MSEHDDITVWVDGRLTTGGTATVSALDHALLTGDGVFETLRVYDHRPFALTRHLDRLRTSAAGLGLPLPADAALREAIDAVVERSRLADARLRVTVTGGATPLGSERSAAAPTVIVACGPMAPWPPHTAVVTAPWPRNERSALANVKTVSYAENVVALAWARERGAGEALLLNTRGELCEGTGSNVFVVLDGRLVTPPIESGCLAGITRALLIERTGAVEAVVTAEDLRRVEEAFLSSSTREVQPVSAIDGRTLAAPGPLTAAAATALDTLLGQTSDP